MTDTAFQHAHHALLRVWHWVTFLVITGLLFTILLQEQVFDLQDKVPKITEKLQTEGVSVTEDQARKVNRIYRAQVWDWHKKLGITLSFLFLLRLLAEARQAKEARLGARLGAAMRLYRSQADDARHFLGVQIVYGLFYTVLVAMIITGLCLYFEDDFAFLESSIGFLEEIHELGMYAVLAFMAMHLLGVLLAETGKYAGIVSRMINGK